jgi:hypothetical protein
MSRMFRGTAPSGLGTQAPGVNANFVQIRPDTSQYDQLMGVLTGFKGITQGVGQLGQIAQQQARYEYRAEYLEKQAQDAIERKNKEFEEARIEDLSNQVAAIRAEFRLDPTKAASSLEQLGASLSPDDQAGLDVVNKGLIGNATAERIDQRDQERDLQRNLEAEIQLAADKALNELDFRELTPEQISDLSDELLTQQLQLHEEMGLDKTSSLKEEKRLVNNLHRKELEALKDIEEQDRLMMEGRRPVLMLAHADAALDGEDNPVGTLAELARVNQGESTDDQLITELSDSVMDAVEADLNSLNPFLGVQRVERVLALVDQPLDEDASRIEIVSRNEIKAKLIALRDKERDRLLEQVVRNQDPTYTARLESAQAWGAASAAEKQALIDEVADAIPGYDRVAIAEQAREALESNYKGLTSTPKGLEQKFNAAQAVQNDRATQADVNALDAGLREMETKDLWDNLSLEDFKDVWEAPAGESPGSKELWLSTGLVPKSVSDLIDVGARAEPGSAPYVKALILANSTGNTHETGNDEFEFVSKVFDPNSPDLVGESLKWAGLAKGALEVEPDLNNEKAVVDWGTVGFPDYSGYDPGQSISKQSLEALENNQDFIAGYVYQPNNTELTPQDRVQMGLQMLSRSGFAPVFQDQMSSTGPEQSLVIIEDPHGHLDRLPEWHASAEHPVVLGHLQNEYNNLSKDDARFDAMDDENTHVVVDVLGTAESGNPVYSILRKHSDGSFQSMGRIEMPAVQVEQLMSFESRGNERGWARAGRELVEDLQREGENLRTAVNDQVAPRRKTPEEMMAIRNWEARMRESELAVASHDDGVRDWLNGMFMKVIPGYKGN